MAYTGAMPTALPLRPHRLRSRRGFTLMELAITLAIAAILAALGLSMTDGLIPRQRAKKAALEFQAHAMECRNMAIQSGRQCRVLLVDFDDNLADVESPNEGEYWIQLGDAARDSSTWDTLPVDDDGSDSNRGQGEIAFGSGSNARLRYISLADWGSISGPGTGNANAIVFDSRGWVANPSEDFLASGNGYIVVRFVNKHALDKGIDDTYTVRVSRAGMVRVDSEMNPSFDGLPSSGTGLASSAN
jgi:prepilin-type N-terminal cleavage/methylation domain-containing protein